MIFITKKEYLQQYKLLDNYINSKIEELTKWKSIATKITPTFSDMPKASGISDKVGQAVEKIIELQNEINNSIDKLVDLRQEIENKIEAIEDAKLKQLLFYKFIHGLTFEQIAEKMNYSVRNIMYLYDDSLDQIDL